MPVGQLVGHRTDCGLVKKAWGWPSTESDLDPTFFSGTAYSDECRVKRAQVCERISRSYVIFCSRYFGAKPAKSSGQMARKKYGEFFAGVSPAAPISPSTSSSRTLPTLSISESGRANTVIPTQCEGGLVVVYPDLRYLGQRVGPREPRARRRRQHRHRHPSQNAVGLRRLFRIRDVAPWRRRAIRSIRQPTTTHRIRWDRWRTRRIIARVARS